MPDCFTYMIDFQSASSRNFWDVAVGRLQKGRAVYDRRGSGGEIFPNTPTAIDARGVAVLDIDRDGVLDVYAVTGAADATSRGLDQHNQLFWGQGQANAFEGPNFTLLGGLMASRKA